MLYSCTHPSKIRNKARDRVSRANTSVARMQDAYSHCVYVFDKWEQHHVNETTSPPKKWSRMATQVDGIFFENLCLHQIQIF